MPGAHRKQQYDKVPLAQIYVGGTGDTHFGLFSAVKNHEFLHAPRCCGLLHLEWWPYSAWICRIDLPSYFLPVPSCYLVSCEKVHIVSAWTICHLSPLLLPALPEAVGNLAPEMIFHSCLETPWGVRGFLCNYLMFAVDSRWYWMLSRHNFCPSFHSFYYRVCFGSTVPPSSMGMGARKSLQAGRISFHANPDNWCASASAGAAVLSGDRPFTGHERTEAWIYPI